MRNYALAVYILYAASILVGITAIVGVIIAYIKRDEMAGTIYYDHMQYLIKTFWIALAGSIIGWITSFIGIGLIVLFIVGLWFIYRVVVGFIKFNDNKPVSAEGWL
ncbi:membrane protein [Neisseria sp. 83E34]|nr:membrane protein [Neisseria sp. 83E34]